MNFDKNDGAPILLDLSPEEAARESMIGDWLYVDGLNHRIISLTDEIDAGIGDSIVHDILWFNRVDQENNIPPENRKPIRFYIDSPGGELMPSLKIVDAVRMSETPIWTINLGLAASGAFYIFINGHKRISMPMATSLLHEGTRGGADTTSKMEDRMRWLDGIEKKIESFVIEKSGKKLTHERYKAMYTKEWYMSASEAKKEGFVDAIIGEKGWTMSKIV